MKWLVKETSKTQITDFDFSRGGYHDICGLEVTVEDPIGVKILTAVQELEHYRFDGWSRDRMASRLGVMMNDLEEVVLGIFENHEDTFILEDNFDEPDDIHVT